MEIGFAAALVWNGNPHNVANTARACAILGIQSPVLFTEIERRSSWLLANGSPVHVAITVWACAKLGVSSPRLFAEIERHATWLVANGNSNDIGNAA
jgi:hypothetical protein